MRLTRIEVSSDTRDRVKALADQQHSTAEQVIIRALDLWDRELRRQRMASQSKVAADNPVDRAEIAAVRAALDHARAW